jgi:hypothetical protein
MPTGHYGLDLILPTGVADSIHNFPLVSWGALFYTPDITPLHQWAVNLGWFSPYMTLNIINIAICLSIVIGSYRLKKHRYFRHPWQ